MQLTVKNGKVTFLMRAGKDFAMSMMSENAAKEIIANGEVTMTDIHPGFPLTVNGTYFFESKEEKKEKRFGREQQE